MIRLIFAGRSLSLGKCHHYQLVLVYVALRLAWLKINAVLYFNIHDSPTWFSIKCLAAYLCRRAVLLSHRFSRAMTPAILAGYHFHHFQCPALRLRF